jgi:dihydroorotate dehydrogenase
MRLFQRRGYKLIFRCAAAALLAAGCDSKSAQEYQPLEQAGFSSATIKQLKKLNVSDVEIPQIVKLKDLGLSDGTCVAMVQDARSHHHIFDSGDSAGNMAGAGYSEQDILAMANSDQLDGISTDAITLKLIGLSQPTVQFLVNRHIQGQPTLSSAAIGRLKNTGMSESQILQRINEGMTDEEAEKEAAVREAKRNHANTDFVRNSGRRR